jgi:hypothetical protein
MTDTTAARLAEIAEHMAALAKSLQALTVDLTNDEPLSVEPPTVSVNAVEISVGQYL